MKIALGVRPPARAGMKPAPTPSGTTRTFERSNFRTIFILTGCGAARQALKSSAILLVDPGWALHRQVRHVLSHYVSDVVEASNLSHVHRAYQAKSPALIVIGPSLAGTWNGLEVAEEVRRWDRTVPIVLIVRMTSEQLAIAALRAGVNDLLKDPFSVEELTASVRQCLGENGRPTLPGQSNSLADSPGGGERMVGESPAMREVKVYLRKVAPTDSNVLITGETGTGKELAAELIHLNSPRSRKPLVCINCAAIPDSLLESELFGYERGAFTGASSPKEGQLQLADKGTVFFDEIAEMSPFAQAKILRAIESKQVYRLGGRRSIPLDIRFIAATNQDMERLVGEAKFRKDLYFRLNVARLHLPPLQERKEDIPRLLAHYIPDFNRRFGREVEGFTGEALAYLIRYDWPGNVRELKNMVEAIFINLPPENVAYIDLPEPLRKRLGKMEELPQDERDRLLAALLSTKWNKSKAAKALRWSRMTLYRKMAKYQISSGSGL